MTKSKKPTIRIHDTSIDEIIDREMTDDEFAQYEAEQEKEVARLAAIETKAAEKAALLEKLGITADEAKLLLG